MNITKISSEISVLINEAVAAIAEKLMNLVERISKAVQSLLADKEIQMKSMISMDVEQIVEDTQNRELNIFKEKVYPEKKEVIESQIRSLEKEKHRREFYQEYLENNFDPFINTSRESALQTLEESLVDDNKPVSWEEVHRRMEKGVSLSKDIFLSIQEEIRHFWQECIDYRPKVNGIPMELDKFSYATLNIRSVIVKEMKNARKALNEINEKIGHLEGELFTMTNAAMKWDDDRALRYIKVAELV